MDSFQASVTDFVFSDRNTDSEVTIMYNDNRIYIAISADNLTKSSNIKNQYLYFLQVAEAFELDGLTVDDFYDWILDGCAPKLLYLHPTPPSRADPTLHDFIHPKTFHYALHATEDDHFALLDRTTALDELPFGVDVCKALCSSWPILTPSQVKICVDSPEQALSKMPRKVLINGKHVRFFKPYRRCDTLLAKHELTKYREIKEADLGNIQICQLTGLVQDISGTVFGLLLSYIESKSLTLSCAIRPDTPVSLRGQWADQVRDTLFSLHGAGIVWGDAKPDNVLIDSSNNAWIIDFGGGYTQGWVDEEIAGTFKGDLQGLSRIIDHIFA